MGNEWKLWGQSLRGRRHRKKEMMCQDQYACKTADGRLSVALVDGIGTTDVNAKAGKRVAELTVAFFMEQAEHIKESDEYTIAYNLMKRIQRLLDQMSDEYGVHVKELSTTLLGIYIDPGEGRYVAVHLGDGIIAAWDGNQKIRVISKPQTGRKLNETVLTTSDTALGNVRILKAPLGNTKTFVMATDGFYNNWEDRASLNNVFMHSKKDVRIEERTDDQTVIKIQLTGGENKISMEDYQYGVLLG
jgi:serine/threonine protein phosphatase PrpC